MSAIVDEGVSLLAVVEAGSSGKRLDELSVARVIADAAEALDGAAPRTQPIVPAGVIILLNGSVKVETKLVPLREAIGYTAPEKIKGQSVDHRSDVFSLGVVMWEALTHTHLFEGATEAEMKTAVLETELHPPSAHNANVPSELDAICMKALARDPDQRYATAKAMAVELEGVLRDAGYGRTNEPIAAYIVKLPTSARKKTKTLPPPKPPEPPTLTSAVDAGLAAAPVPNPPKLPTPVPASLPSVLGKDTLVDAKVEPSLLGKDTLVDAPAPKPAATIVEDNKSTIVGIASTAREPAKIVEDNKSTIVGFGNAAREPAKPVANTVTGVPSLASVLPEAKPGAATVMGVPALASVLPEPKPAPSPAGSMPAMQAAEEPIVLTPKPPKLPAASNGPRQVPPAVAAAVTQAVPAAPVTAQPPPADDDFQDEQSPNPADAVSLPRAKSETGPQDQLNRWAWSTDTHPALDDEPLDDIPPPSKKPLFIAIGAAAGVLGIVVLIAFAAGGSKDDKDKKDDQASARTEEPAPVPTPAPSPIVEPPKQEPPPSEPAKQEVAEAPKQSITPPAPAEPPKQEPPPPVEPAKVEPAKPAPPPVVAKAEPPPAVVAKAEPPKAEPPKAEPPKADAKKVEPPSIKAPAEPPKADAKKAEPPKAIAKAEPPKAEPPKAEPPKAEPPKADAKKVAKADAPKKDAKTAAKKPEPKPTRVATKAKPVDPYPDAPAKPKVDAEAAYRAGVQQFARGDTSGALASLRSALNENPRFPPTWRGLGLVYEKLGDRTQAVRAYRRYLQLAPNAGDAEQIRGRLERLGS